MCSETYCVYQHYKETKKKSINGNGNILRTARYIFEVQECPDLVNAYGGGGRGVPSTTVLHEVQTRFVICMTSYERLEKQKQLSLCYLSLLS